MAVTRALARSRHPNQPAVRRSDAADAPRVVLECETCAHWEAPPKPLVLVEDRSPEQLAADGDAPKPLGKWTPPPGWPADLPQSGIPRGWGRCLATRIDDARKMPRLLVVVADDGGDLYTDPRFACSAYGAKEPAARPTARPFTNEQRIALRAEATLLEKAAPVCGRCGHEPCCFCSTWCDVLHEGDTAEHEDGDLCCDGECDVGAAGSAWSTLVCEFLERWTLSGWPVARLPDAELEEVHR